MTPEDYLSIARRVARVSWLDWWHREDAEGFIVLRLWERQPDTSALTWAIAKGARADFVKQDRSWHHRHERGIDRGTIVEIPTIDAVDAGVVGSLRVQDIIDVFSHDERQQRVIRLLSEGYTQTEVAEMEGITKSAIQYRISGVRALIE